ncbi:putative RNA-directed DNA polymerase [Arabidopsis thaliana]
MSLNKRFSMKDLGAPSYFLGVEIESSPEGLFLHQTAYAKDILHQAAMSNCNSMPTPLPQHIENLNSDLFPEPTYFRSLAGKLQYLTITRPDIQFAVNFICQRMHSPTTADFGLLKRILRYVKGTIHLGLHIKKNQNLSLVAYSDSDWAGCKETRRSTTGFCTLLGCNLISWSAKRQETVSKSSTEAEYRALTAVAQELTWLSFLLRDIGQFI